MPSFRLYDVLGVPKSCSQDELKKAYKRLAMQHHPDKGGDPDKFKEISSAYDTLGDEAKRREYDTFGDDGPQGMPGPGMNPFDIFEHMFAGGHFGGGAARGMPRKGKNIEKPIKISLRDAYTGVKKKFEITNTMMCEACSEPCGQCGGQGVVHRIANHFGMILQQQVECGACGGKGMRPAGKSCNACHGAGALTRKEQISVDIPPGARSGINIVVRGMGEDHLSHVNGRLMHTPGDLVLAVTVDGEQGNLQRLAPDDLLYKCKMPYWKMLCNPDHILIDHFKDPQLRINFQDPIDHRREYLFEGLGMPVLGQSGRFGRLVVKFEVEFPSRKLGQEESDRLMATLKDLNLLSL
jgi:DnaJ homolog subfamily A member 2